MSQMFKRFLMIPMSILWGSLLAMRLLIAREVLGNLLRAPWFDCAFFLFVLSVGVCEILVLLRARRAYSALPEPTVTPYDRLGGIQSFKGTGVKKFLLLIFVFCLPLGLWDSRYTAVGSAVPGLMVGAAFNLLFTAMLANAVFLTEDKTGQLQIT